MRSQIRPGTIEDRARLKELYCRVAAIEGGLVRKPDEITDHYIQHITSKSLDNGAWWVAESDSGVLVGSIHAFRPGPRDFAHVLGELTICVSPDCQRQGIGRSLFSRLLTQLNGRLDNITRVELMARESNKEAIRLYESLGFKIEGRFENRVRSIGGGFEADIAMAWIK